MKKELIITAISIKHGGFCVSGIYTMNSKHYRLCSSDETTNGAVSQKQLMYKNGKQIEVLDVCLVEVVKKTAELLQPENILINWDDRPIFTKKFDRTKISNYCTDYNRVFFDSCRRIDPDNIPNNGDPLHSLELIKVEDFEVLVYIDLFNKKKFNGRFTYKGVVYSDISVTDPKIRMQCSLPKLYIFGTRTLLVSLGVKFSDGFMYKLVASVI